MQYISELPQVSSIGVGGDIIELELEQEIDQLPYGVNEPVILTASYAGQVVVATGKVIEHENIDLENSASDHAWCRIKIKGSCVTFTI